VQVRTRVSLAAIARNSSNRLRSFTDTAVLLIDPDNDYIHPDGKVYDLCKDSLEANEMIAHVKTLVTTARATKIPIFYCLHQPWKVCNFNA
jgi:hypothetical protein